MKKLVYVMMIQGYLMIGMDGKWKLVEDEGGSLREDVDSNKAT